MTQAVLATRAGVSTPTQVAYERAARKPALDYLIALQEAGIDVWFVMFNVRAEQRAGDVLDWELLIDIQVAVSDWCSGREIDLSQRKLVEVSRLLYDQFISTGVVQPEVMERVLRLVA